MDIRPIPAEGRTLGGFDFLLLWAGVGISLAEIWAGRFSDAHGLWAGLAAIVLGHLIGNTLMALGGVIGSDQGIMSMVSIRPAFGVRGSNLAAVLNIIQLIGWAAVMLIIGGPGRRNAGPNAPAASWRPITSGVSLSDWLRWYGPILPAVQSGKCLQKVAVIGLLVLVVLMSWVSLNEFGQGLTAVKPNGCRS